MIVDYLDDNGLYLTIEEMHDVRIEQNEAGVRAIFTITMTAEEKTQLQIYLKDKFKEYTLHNQRGMSEINQYYK